MIADVSLLEARSRYTRCFRSAWSRRGDWRRAVQRWHDHCRFPSLAADYPAILIVTRPAGQNNPGPLRKALDELRVVDHLPAAVLLLHQTCAARSRTRARGPLAAFADILIDMQVPSGDRFTRRRHFHGVGRYPGSVQHVTAELNPEGTDYLLLPDSRQEAALDFARDASDPGQAGGGGHRIAVGCLLPASRISPEFVFG